MKRAYRRILSHNFQSVARTAAAAVGRSGPQSGDELMNRRQRRANRPPARLAKRVACPDCNSDITLSDCGHLEVHHDETCPWYANLKATGGAGIRFGRHNHEGDE